MCVTERRQRDSTLLGKLFDIHVEDVINRKQWDPPQCPTATRQGHTKHSQYKHFWYMDIYSYQACQNIKALHEHCLHEYKNGFCDMSLTHKSWQLHTSLQLSRLKYWDFFFFFLQMNPVDVWQITGTKRLKYLVGRHEPPHQLQCSLALICYPFVYNQTTRLTYVSIKWSETILCITKVVQK